MITPTALAKDLPRRAKKADQSEKPPFVGMTKAQALARYGEPKKHTVADEGEQWVYVLNMGEVIGKAFNPFNFKPTLVRTGVLIFGGDGKVKKFTWDAETNVDENSTHHLHRIRAHELHRDAHKHFASGSIASVRAIARTARFTFGIGKGRRAANSC